MRKATKRSRRMPCFNPHPPLRADAMMLGSHLVLRLWAFQSSPALTGGCYQQPGRQRPGRPWFQSSPALTGGCYNREAVVLAPLIRFQSSPALTGGCYLSSVPLSGKSIVVSILTRPYGRMLFEQSFKSAARDCFNPHPPLRADAIGVPLRQPRVSPRFNPHPPLRADAIG